jgi:hypothetical protein
MENWFRGAVVGASLGVAIWAGSCGGGTGGGGGSVSPIPTSVPGNKRISDLTPVEHEQFCADVAAWAMSGPLLTDGCNVDAWLASYAQSTVSVAATDAELRATCASLYADCVANGVTSSCDTMNPSTCAATVSEYNQCLLDTVSFLGTVPGCDEVTREALASTAARFNAHTASSACMAVQTKCPNSGM